MKRVVSALLTLALFLSLSVPAFAAREFSDVPAGYVFHDSIQDCVDKGLLSGFTDGSFRPADSVTRAQFNVMLARLFYPGQAESSRYASWKQRVGWYGPYSAVLKDHGAMTYGDEYWMDPSVMNVSITRRDMAQFLGRALKAEGFSVSESEKAAAQAKISDFSKIGEYYEDAVKTVYALGIITGYANNEFAGSATMTRGQASAILYRTSQCIAKGPGELTPVQQEGSVKPVTLLNGKAITEENVLEILAEQKVLYPENTNFAKGYPLGNDSEVRNATYPYERSRDPKTHTSNTLGCGGWATQLSDTIFGQEGFPNRKVSMTDARPGDVMVMTDKNGRLVHVALITQRSTVSADGGVTMYITEAATDDNGVYHLHWDRTYTWREGGTYGYDIYTRYPA